MAQMERGVQSMTKSAKVECSGTEEESHKGLGKREAKGILPTFLGNWFLKKSVARFWLMDLLPQWRSGEGTWRLKALRFLLIDLVSRDEDIGCRNQTCLPSQEQRTTGIFSIPLFYQLPALQPNVFQDVHPLNLEIKISELTCRPFLSASTAEPRGKAARSRNRLH